MKKGRSAGNDVREAREERRAGESSSTMVGREGGTMEAKQEVRPRTDPRPGPAPGTRRIWCSECDKYLAGGPSNLQLHLDTVHLHLRPWECDRCGAKFGRRSCLEQHITTLHLGLRLHACSVEGCGKIFTTSGNLKNHWRAEHGLPLLVYPCGATFVCSQELNKHKKTLKSATEA